MTYGKYQTYGSYCSRPSGGMTDSDGSRSVTQTIRLAPRRCERGEQLVGLAVELVRPVVEVGPVALPQRVVAEADDDRLADRRVRRRASSSFDWCSISAGAAAEVDV